MISLAFAVLLTLSKPQPPVPSAPAVAPAPSAADDSDDAEEAKDAEAEADAGGGLSVRVTPNGVQIQGSAHRHGHHYDKGYRPGDEHSRVATGDIVVHAGDPAESTVAVGGSIEIEPGATVLDAVAVGGSVKAGAGATIDGDVVAVGGSVELASGAKVAGDSVAIGGSVEQAQGAQVDGDHVSLGLPGLGALIALAAGFVGLGVVSPFWVIGSVAAKLVVFLALGLILLALWPRRLEQLSDEIFRIPGRSVLLGVLSVPAIPLLMVLLCITIIGITLVPVEVLAVALMSAMGFSALALAVGRRLPLGKGQPALQLVVGSLLLVFVMSVPILGMLLTFGCWVWVFGAVVATRFGHVPAVMPPPPVSPPAGV